MPPLLTSPKEALKRLHHFTYNPTPYQNPAKCLYFLRCKQINYQILTLYQQLFPKEFEQSQASSFPQIVGGHSDREIEFMNLLYDQYFPIDYNKIENASENIVPKIFPVPIGFSWKYVDDLYSLPPGWRFLIIFTMTGYDWFEQLLMKEEEESFEINLFETEHNIKISEIIPPYNFDFLAFEKRCFLQPKPLCYFPLCIRFLEGATQNIWLDLSEQEFYDYGDQINFEFDWLFENINYLHQTYQEAKQICNQCNALIDWLEKDITTHCSILLNLWNSNQLTQTN